MNLFKRIFTYQPCFLTHTQADVVGSRGHGCLCERRYECKGSYFFYSEIIIAIIMKLMYVGGTSMINRILLPPFSETLFADRVNLSAGVGAFHARCVSARLQDGVL